MNIKICIKVEGNSEYETLKWFEDNTSVLWVGGHNPTELAPVVESDSFYLVFNQDNYMLSFSYPTKPENSTQISLEAFKERVKRFCPKMEELMEYKNREETEIAADQFLLDKANAGFIVKKYVYKNEISINYRTDNPKTDWDSKKFNFKPLPKIDKDTPVLVRNFDDCPWLHAHTTGEFLNNGDILCWLDGKTSFTTQLKTNWKQYKLID